MPKTPPNEPYVNRFGIWLKGAFISNLCGFVCLGILVVFQTHSDYKRVLHVGEWTSGVLVASTFLALPFAMGFGASFFWKAADLSGSTIAGWTLCNLLVSMGGAGLVLREGSLCLIMASPLLFLLMWAGCGTGLVFWERNSFLGASVLPVVFALAVTDASQPHFYANAVTTEVHSALPPTKLWPYVASYPLNTTPPDWWLWQLGLPYPVQAKGQPELGGRRDCNFSGGVSVGERVVKVERGRSLEFVVDKQPNHPEVMHHFQLVRGRLQLLPDGRGGTIMRGTSWYRLQVYPAWYFGPWCDSIIHHVHTRVFLHMERCARRNLKAN